MFLRCSGFSAGTPPNHLEPALELCRGLMNWSFEVAKTTLLDIQIAVTATWTTDSKP